MSKLNSLVCGIVGTRTFTDFVLFQSVMKKIRLADGNITRLVSGGAKGADKLAERYSMVYNIPIKVFYPDWKTYGKSAGPIRNKLIVKASDFVVAFWDHSSRGTLSSINFAKSFGKPVHIIDIRKGS